MQSKGGLGLPEHADQTVSKDWLKCFLPLSLICQQAKGISDQRILQSDWWRAFLTLTQEQEFPEIWDL